MSRLPSLPNTFKTVSFFFPGNPVVRSHWDAAGGLAGASHDVPGPTTSQERGKLLQKKIKNMKGALHTCCRLKSSM